MDPEMDDLFSLMKADARADDEGALGAGRFAERTTPEGRALELAIASIEVLRECGSVTGKEICRIATLLGFDAQAIARAWNTRTEFDLEKTRYGFDAPIARVLPLP